MTRIGLVCRFKPVHLGHAAMLQSICERADHAVIGLGSPNRYDARNPFTLEESADMIRLALAGFSNYELVEVPDLGHGPRWRAMVAQGFGALDLFVSANDYVRSLMGTVYPLAHPLDLVPPERRAPVDGTLVRRALARGEAWEHLVPAAVADYMHAHDLPERFRSEFGLQTLAADLAKETTHVLLG